MTAPAEDPRGGEAEYAGHVGSCRIFYAERRCTCIGPAAGRGDTDRKRYCEDCTPGLSCQLCEVTAAPVTGPATDRGATDRGGEAVCKCPFGGCACDHTARPAGDRAQPTQELHAELAVFLYDYGAGQPWEAADALLAGPLAALLDTQAAVNRVEAVMAAWDRGEPVGGYLPREIRRALDGTT